MIITRLNLISFGKFNEMELGLTPGLNIIYGPNEAGKSTIQKFIQGMFFGFKKPFKSRRVYTPDYQAYQPWNSGQYRGIMEYQDQGTSYQVERDFKEDVVVIRDPHTKETLVHQFQQHPGTREYNFAEKHLQVNQNIFSNTTCISQSGCATDEELAREISARLANLSYSGTVDISIRKCSLGLDRVMEGQVGKKNPAQGPLGSRFKELEKLEQERDRAGCAARKVRSLEVQLAENRPSILGCLDKKRSKEQEIKELQDILLAARLKEIQEQEDRIAGLNKRIFEREKYRYYPVHQRERITALKGFIQKLDDEWRRNEEGLKKLEKTKGQPEKYLQKYSYLQGLDMESASAISRDYALYASFKEQISHKEELLEKNQVALNDIDLEIKRDFWQRGCREDLYRAEQLEEEINNRRCSLLKHRIDLLQEKKDMLKVQFRNQKNQLLLIISLTAGVLAPSLWLNPWLSFFLLLPASLTVNLWHAYKSNQQEYFQLGDEIAEIADLDCQEQEERVQMERELKVIMENNQVETPRDFRVKLSQYGVLQGEKKRLERERKMLKREIQDLSCRQQEFIQDIKGLLQAASLWREGDRITPKKVDEFKNRLHNYQDTLGIVKNINNKIAGHLEIKKKLEKERYDYQEEAEFIFLSAGVNSFPEYFDGCREHREVTILLEQREKHESVRKVLQEGIPREDLKRAGKINQGQLLTKIPEINPTGTVDREGRITLGEILKEKEGELRRVNEGLNQARNRQSQLEAKIESARQGYRPLHEIEESINRVLREIAFLKRQGEALKAAKKMIEVVARDIHRDFAPRLNQEVSQLIHKITRNRYQQVRISKELDISVAAPETGKQVNLRELSGGTIDQFYFSARVMIADLVTGNNRLPLILDDSFVQYDSQRLKEVLKVLGDQARYRQVILFTCHSREIDILKEMKGKFNLINLGEPEVFLITGHLEPKRQKA